MKCIIFARVSTQAQSLESQIQTLQEEAVRQGYNTDNQIIIEQKESGISLKEEERIGLERLKNTILTNKDVNCLFTWEISRISRRPEQIYSIRNLLIEHKMRWMNLEPYIEILDSNGSQNQMSNLLLSIFASMAETETQIKKERAKRGIQYSREAGNIAGGYALKGYKANRKTKKYEIDPIESKRVQTIFQMYSTGQYTYRSLGKELKDMGYFLKTDLHSTAGIIGGWLNDERYTGTSSRYPQIISKELFDKCQEVMKKHKIDTTTANKKNMLCKGIIHSKTTGYALIGYASRYHTHPDYKPTVSIQQDIIDNLVADFTQNMINKYYRNSDKIKKELESHNKLFIKKLAVITYNRLKTEEKLERLQETYIEGKISKAKSEQLLQKYQADIKMYESQEISLGEEFNKKKDFLNSLSPIDFSKLDFQDKRKYLLQVISKIEIYKEKPLCRTTEVTIHCKLDNKEHVYLLNSNTGEYKII